MKHNGNTRRLSDQLGEHADARIRFEADAMLVIDALEQHLDHGLQPELLAAVAQRAAKSRDRLALLERRSGLDLGRDEHPRTLADLISETAEEPEEPPPHPSCCDVCGVLVPSYDTECPNGHGVQP